MRSEANLRVLTTNGPEGQPAPAAPALADDDTNTQTEPAAPADQPAPAPAATNSEPPEEGDLINLADYQAIAEEFISSALLNGVLDMENTARVPEVASVLAILFEQVAGAAQREAIENAEKFINELTRQVEGIMEFERKVMLSRMDQLEAVLGASVKLYMAPSGRHTERANKALLEAVAAFLAANPIQPPAAPAAPGLKKFNPEPKPDNNNKDNLIRLIK